MPLQKKSIDVIHMKVCKQGPMFTAVFSFTYAVYIGWSGITRVLERHE